jgi:hypothetical protein
MGKNARKKLQRASIIHTDHLKGHDASDIIVVYSKYEDIITTPQVQKKLYFPQWICTDMVTETSGIWLPMPQRVACTYEEMKDLALNGLKNLVSGPFGNIKFYYQSTILVVNGTTPFK